MKVNQTEGNIKQKKGNAHDDDDCGAVGVMRFGRETIVLRGNLPQHQFVHYKSHMT
jgi:hypothetical protein